MASPTVSVIMPLYNKGQYVAKAIKSVLTQTFQDWELMIVYDLSTDDSLAVASGFMDDKRIRITQLESKLGVSHARNVGINFSKGKYVAFLDADDVYAPDKLELQLSLMESKNDDAVVYSDYYSVEEKGELISGSHPGTIIEGRILVNLLERIGVTWAPSIFVLYSDLIKVGLYDESLHIGEDYDLILKLARFRPFYAVKKPVYGHRIVASGLWNSTAKESSYATNLSIMERHIAANKIKTNFMIRDQIACCLIISRDFNKALVYTLRDPRYLGSFMRWARITYDRKFRHARIEDLGS